MTTRQRLAILVLLAAFLLSSVACTCLYEGAARHEPMCDYTPPPPTVTPALQPVPLH